VRWHLTKLNYRDSLFTSLASHTTCHAFHLSFLPSWSVKFQVQHSVRHPLLSSSAGHFVSPAPIYGRKTSFHLCSRLVGEEEARQERRWSECVAPQSTLATYITEEKREDALAAGLVVGSVSWVGLAVYAVSKSGDPYHITLLSSSLSTIPASHPDTKRVDRAATEDTGRALSDLTS
jgi:hypothetical protein